MALYLERHLPDDVLQMYEGNKLLTLTHSELAKLMWQCPAYTENQRAGNDVCMCSV
jgi:hypothetical protein